MKVLALTVSCHGFTAMPMAAMRYALHPSSVFFSVETRCFSWTYPLRMLRYLVLYEVRSIADATVLRMRLTQTWAKAQAADAKNLDHSNQLNRIGVRYWGS
jgi:hypothetical protein